MANMYKKTNLVREREERRDMFGRFNKKVKVVKEEWRRGSELYNKRKYG